MGAIAEAVYALGKYIHGKAGEYKVVVDVGELLVCHVLVAYWQFGVIFQ